MSDNKNGNSNSQKPKGNNSKTLGYKAQESAIGKNSNRNSNQESQKSMSFDKPPVRPKK